MANDEPNPIIKKMHEIDGNPPGERIDPEQFRNHQSAKMLLAKPGERAAFIEQIAATIADDRNGSLKSRAELLELYRDARRTHAQLLALKR
jgi:hypothetical protein